MKAITVDKLKVCYKVSDSLHELLQEKNSLVFGSFELQYKYSQFSQVVYNVVYIDNTIPISHNILGELAISLSEEYDENSPRYAWFEYLNETLYSVNDQHFLYDLIKALESDLEAELNNITNFELALDADTNLGDIIQEAYTDVHAEVIVMGKAYNTEEIPYVTCEDRGTRFSPTHRHWRIKGFDTKFQLYCYDKAQELSRSQKRYIPAYYGVQSFETFWRLEIRCYKEFLWDYLQNNYITWDEFLSNLLSAEHKPEIMDYLSGRFLRFRYSRINKPSVYTYINNQLS